LKYLSCGASSQNEVTVSLRSILLTTVNNSDLRPQMLVRGEGHRRVHMWENLTGSLIHTWLEHLMQVYCMKI